MLPSAYVNDTRGRRSMERGFVFVLVLSCLSSEVSVSASSHGALEKLIEWHGTGGSLSQEQFISLGKGVQSGQAVTTSGNLLAGENGSCPCQTYSQIFKETLTGGNRINASSLSAVCPQLLLKIHSEGCCHDNNVVQEHAEKPPIGQAWGYGIGFVTSVVLISNIGVFLGPCMHTKAFRRILMFCVALAVGTLGSTGFLVLIPESMHLTGKDTPIPDYSWKMATVIGGAYFVFVAERLLKFILEKRKKNKFNNDSVEVSEENSKELLAVNSNNTHGHTHSHLPVGLGEGGNGEVAPVAWILLIGDSIHNFVDGLSIGAAFTENTFLGISVSLAVLCEELPHELGDIAILLHAGLSMKKALFYNFIAAVICYIGLVIGLIVGEATSANQWIFGLAGGIFVYIALADMCIMPLTSLRRNLLLQHRRLKEYQLKQKRIRLLKRNEELLRHLRLYRKNLLRLRELAKKAEKYYQIKLDRGRHSRKFKVQENVYNVNFKPLPEKDHSPFVRNVLDAMLNEVKSEMNCRPNDYLRLNIRHPSLDSDIWYEFTQSKHLDARGILEKIKGVQQSKRDFTMTDGAIQFEFFHVQYPEGSGGNKKKHLLLNKENFKKGKKSIVSIQNTDSLCLPRAIVVARLHSKKPQDPVALEVWGKQWTRMMKGDCRSVDQKKQALELMELAGCDPELPCGPIEWRKLQQVLCPEFRLKIFQFETNTRALKLKPIYKGHGNGKCLNVLLDRGHYDTILSMPGVSEHKYYCDYCDVGYSHIEEHRTKCPHRCSFCLGDTPCPPEGLSIECSECHGFFKSMGCYQRHLEPNNSKTNTSVCHLMDRCQHCQTWMTKKLLANHKCKGQKQCKICKKIVESDHQCYVQKKPEKKKDKLQLYIYFDFECTQEHGIHSPNLCVAHRVCQHCDHLPVDEACTHCQSLGPRQHVFQGPDTLKEFVDWLLKSECQNKTTHLVHDGAIVIAHNFKGYDGQFILNYIVHKACIKPSVIMNGSKILSMNICDIKFIDSYNYLPFALAKMPSAFGLQELKKGYFPHFFNTEQNQDYLGVYPPPAYYNPDDMSTAGRKDFYAWYEQQRGKVFNFREEFLAYCISDVDILRRCCAKFRATIQSQVRVNPFQEALTFASTANLAYRRSFMSDQTIAIIPNLGYHPARQYSIKACRWLAWMGRRCSIRHAKNGGEVRLENYTVDGYDENTQTVYEFHGCYWHGCPTCYPDRTTDIHPHHPDRTYATVYEQTLRREQELRDKGYKVISIWEHEFDSQLKNQEELRNFVQELDFQDPLNPRDSLYGGRTNAIRLFCTEGDMRYVDVCSLYPYVLKYRPFPVGHPEVLSDNFGDLRAYFGLIKCRVLPPRGLYHPVLPYRSGGKLLFPLCRTCAEQRQSLEPEYQCLHSESERCLTGTWVSTELHKAMDMGYRIERIYEIWHFPQTSNTLFKAYIDTFLKIKQEASGFPPECESEEEKRSYILDIFEREGIMLDPSQIEKNPVKRTIAKLFLNCLWGKFAQRIQLPKSRYLTEEEELQQLLQDCSLEVKGIELLENSEDPNLDMILVNYQEKREFLEECPFGNVVLACFTTAHARLHLYETLEQLGERVLYFDTDSIIYQHEEGKFNPEIINSLGGWTDELDGDRIVKFMSGGPKNYAYITESGKSVCKVKGLTLNYRASTIVSPEALEKMLKEEIDIINVTYPKYIHRTRQHTVQTLPLTKQYRIVYDKRQRISDYRTLPFGF